MQVKLSPEGSEFTLLVARRLPTGEVVLLGEIADDIPLLELVGNPVAVNPDTILRRYALARGWPIMHMKVAQIKAARATAARASKKR